MLTEGQAQVRDLVMGHGTIYRLREFDPWSREVSADQGEKRAWNHGRWSGAEWQAAAVVPMLIRVQGTSAATWLAAHQQLAAAFRPSDQDQDLRWVTGGREYLLRGRPRMVQPRVRMIGTGQVLTNAAFEALDPIIYSGAEHVETLGLPSVSGGLTVPFTVPFVIPATVTSGRRTLTNAGTAPVGLRLRIDGPVPTPRVSLLTATGTASITVHMTLDSSQWLDIDTGARTVLLQGTADRRGLVSSSNGWPILPADGGQLAFDAMSFDAGALTARWRDAWY